MIGVIIARFQCPYLHDGHKHLIERVRQQHPTVVIVLGISPLLGSRQSPLDFPTREKMIKKAYPDTIVLPLPDHPSDTVWSRNLDNLLSHTFPGAHFILYGSRDSFIQYYSGNNKTKELPKANNQTATEIRQALKEKALDAEDFRAGIIYAYANTYLKVYPTVDIAVFKNNKTELLLDKKETDQQWRLPGGFVDPADSSYETAAIREMQEECGMFQTNKMCYEGSFRINDWRYKNEPDKIITTLFSTDYISGEPVANDDIEFIHWATLDALEKMIMNHEIVSEHVILLTTVLNKYKSTYYEKA